MPLITVHSARWHPYHRLRTRLALPNFIDGIRNTVFFHEVQQRNTNPLFRDPWCCFVGWNSFPNRVYSFSFNERRLMRRIAFFLSIRRVSLFETNQRLRRTMLKTPLFTTFLRKRLSKESCDSPSRKLTTATSFTSFPSGNCPKGIILTLHKSACIRRSRWPDGLRPQAAQDRLPPQAR